MNIKKTLLDAGVSEEHLYFLQENKLKNDDSFKCFFEGMGEREYQFVPVKKIKGLSRGKAGFSWWEHVLRKAGNIDSDRLENNQKRLEATTLNEFRKGFASSSFPAVELYYYDEFDEYYVAHDGNHRTLWAKLVDANYIRARVYKYKYSPTKHGNYKRIQCILGDYKKFLHVCNLQLIEGYPEHKGWPVSTHELPYISDYSNEIQISNLKNCLDENIKVIGNIINRYLVLAKIPDKWRMKLFKLLYYISKSNDNKYTYENLVMLQKQGWVPIISFGDWKKLKNDGNFLKERWGK
ncbi:hypothetical protein P9443_17685 [Peribacillus frigoritolerans]|uniref:hypothetical protein n=1 Tax=Peribacillus frigoritolerans TaxID=450367 RepID=UPI002E1C5B92|nr:hypothetical protein [Peribacillus frigoritolerans]